MGRRRRPPADARPIDGWLSIDKPAGLSSAAAVGRLRAALRPRRIGHGGTLDPLATGVLPIALGEATKTVSYVMDATKAYRFTLRFGERRATDDGEGAVLEESPMRPEDEEIEGVLPGFTGTIMQVPPAYSALKVAGEPAYARARKGERPALAPRAVRVDSLRFTGRPDRDRAAFDVLCGKGLYVRALARDIAGALGTVGFVESLRRTRVGRFTETAAIPLDNLAGLGHSARVFEHLLPVATVLDDIPALAVTGEQAAAIRQGRPVRVFFAGGPGPGETGGSAETSELSDGTVVCAMEGTTLVALARYRSGAIRPVRVLNL